MNPGADRDRQNFSSIQSSWETRQMGVSRVQWGPEFRAGVANREEKTGLLFSFQRRGRQEFLARYVTEYWLNSDCSVEVSGPGKSGLVDYGNGRSWWNHLFSVLRHTCLAHMLQKRRRERDNGDQWLTVTMCHCCFVAMLLTNVALYWINY